MEPLLDAELDIPVGLLPGLGDVHHAHQPPLIPVDGGPVFGGPLLHDVPVQGQRIEPGCLGGADRQQPDAVFAGDLGTGRRRHRGDAHVEQRVRVRAEMQAGVAQRPPLVLEVDRVVGPQQLHDDVDALGQQLACLALVEADHGRVGGQRTGAEPQHEPAPGEVVEQHGPLGYPQGVVVADADHPGAELDATGAGRGGGDEDLGRGDDLAAGRVVLADPRFVEIEPVKVLDERQIPLEGQRRVLAGGVERRHEDAESQTVGHACPPLSLPRA